PTPVLLAQARQQQQQQQQQHYGATPCRFERFETPGSDAGAAREPPRNGRWGGRRRSGRCLRQTERTSATAGAHGSSRSNISRRRRKCGRRG
ncbi:unnamed protein product, partial [Ectocarpus fasciculatus]